MNFDNFKGNITTDEQDELCIVVDGNVALPLAIVI
jgi:hypothetical protein